MYEAGLPFLLYMLGAYDSCTYLAVTFNVNQCQLWFTFSSLFVSEMGFLRQSWKVLNIFWKGTETKLVFDLRGFGSIKLEKGVHIHTGPKRWIHYPCTLPRRRIFRQLFQELWKYLLSWSYSNDTHSDIIPKISTHFRVDLEQCLSQSLSFPSTSIESFLLRALTCFLSTEPRWSALLTTRAVRCGAPWTGNLLNLLSQLCCNSWRRTWYLS